MKLFGQLIRTVVNIAALPVEVAKDVVMVVVDAAGNELPGKRTRERLQTLKDEAGETTP
jgi:hypothetical protein